MHVQLLNKSCYIAWTLANAHSFCDTHPTMVLINVDSI
jgi:hypothetical protein